MPTLVLLLQRSRQAGIFRAFEFTTNLEKTFSKISQFLHSHFISYVHAMYTYIWGKNVEGITLIKPEPDIHLLQSTQTFFQISFVGSV
jgi:hypothetical protein